MSPGRYVTLTVSGLRRLQKKVATFNRSFRYRHVELQERIAEALLDEIDHNFETESNAGSPWADLTERTWDSTASKRIGGILTKTGRLRRGFHKIKTGRTNSVTIRNYVPYSKYHEFGNSPWERQPNGMPARPMLPSKTRALAITRGIILNYIDERLKESGLA